jgi:hypothetical protein
MTKDKSKDREGVRLLADTDDSESVLGVHMYRTDIYFTSPPNTWVISCIP